MKKARRGTPYGRKFYKMDEEPCFSCVFDRFRDLPHVDLLWVKQEIYGTPCIPESCPDTVSFEELRSKIDVIEEGEVREPVDGFKINARVNRHERRCPFVESCR